MEVVKEILRVKPSAINDETSENKNILLVAIEERRSEILRELMKHPSWRGKRLRYSMDADGNTAVHLAAKRFFDPNRPVSIAHLSWELSWYLYVMDRIVPPHFKEIRNKAGKTPKMVFSEEHESALKTSDEWVKAMSGNYIVAAVLISGVTFATAYQIPGGYNSEHGTTVIGPSNPPFRTFSISALVSFCFSITSLAVFLSIYSSPIRYMQYLTNLPLKICMGLSTLFISIVSLLLSFCAAHTFELDPKHKSRCVPLYVSLAIIPLVFYSLTQLRLYWRVLRVTFSTMPPSYP